MAMETKHDKAVTDAGRHYKAAYAAQYVALDIREALSLYKGVMTTHPGTQEAGYSRTQIQNIVNNVVPERVLLDAQFELARTRLDHEAQSR